MMDMSRTKLREGKPFTQPLMTTASRKRRLLEIELLESLSDSDEAVDELMGVWMYERGAGYAHDLEWMQQDCSPGLVEEEGVLRDMVYATNYEWMEPTIRLASLLFYKGRWTESYDL